MPPTKPSTKPAAKRAKDEFAQKIEAYSQDYLACRDMGHSWAPKTVERTPAGIKRILECSRCSTAREQMLDGRGYIITNNYGYETGYLIPGVGRLTSAHRAALRIANIHITN